MERELPASSIAAEPLFAANSRAKCRAVKKAVNEDDQFEPFLMN
jgi:hypothetical protein